MKDDWKEILERANGQCELCSNQDHLSLYEVPDSPSDVKETSIVVCATCKEQLLGEQEMVANHWRCLNDSARSAVPAVQVVAYRILDQIKSEGWPADLKDMMYMEEDIKQWAEDGLEDKNTIVHRDSNGNILSKGDNVVLIKDLDVKGANFTAKRGTAVRNINLVHDNQEHIEGTHRCV